MLYKPFFLAISLFCFTQFSKAQVIADALPGCLQVTSMAGMGCGGGAHVFDVVGDQFVAQNVDGEFCCVGQGGDFNAYFEFEPINISCFEDVFISMDYSASDTDYENQSPTAASGCDPANPTFNNGHDQIVFWYSIDGGPFIESAYINGTTQADFTGTWNEGPLNGNTLVIRVNPSNKATAEIFYFENLQVTASVGSVNAGPDAEYCEGETITMAGSGSGSWSGGNGTFSDVNDPNATYTPDASEINTTVTLSYGCQATANCATGASFDEVDITIHETPTASIVQSGDGDLCFGDCTSIEVNFSGGTAPYNMNFELSVGGLFNVPLPLPGFGVNDVVEVCYNGTGILPSINGNTISVPSAAAGVSGELSITSFQDANNCPGTIDGSGFALNFLAAPQAFPAMLEYCEIPGSNGFYAFDLTEMDNTVNAGTGNTVSYWQDMNGTIPVASPFTSSSTTIYANVTNGSCTSEIVPITLLVLPGGDVGNVEISCNSANETDCNICDNDGDGLENVTINFFFPNGGTHTVEMQWTGGTYTNTFNGFNAQETFPVNGSAMFELTSVTADGECPDISDLGDIVNVNLVSSPDITPIAAVDQCSSYTLPNITGTNLTGNEAYFTMPNGGGTMYSAGDIINNSISLYAYDGVTGCSDEELLEININGLEMDDIPVLIECDTLILPPITGPDLSGNQAYYSEPSGMGTVYMAGDTIVESDTLFAFDMVAGCTAQDSVIIIMNPGPQAGVGDSINYCVSQNLIINLPALLTVPADTAGLWQDNMGIIQPNTDSTAVDISGLTGEIIFQYIIQNPDCGPDTSALVIDIANQSFAGGDQTHTTCAGSLNPLLDVTSYFNTASEIDTFITTHTEIDLSDPMAVDIDNLVQGTYTVQHIIRDSEFCEGDTATLSIVITDSPSVDLPPSHSICDGESVDLLTLASFSGGTLTFMDPNNTGALSGSVFNSNAVSPGTYNIQYEFSIEAPCPPATLTNQINIIVRSVDSAGDDVAQTLCEPQSVFLVQQLAGDFTLGGDFVEVSSMTTLSNTQYNFDTPGTHEIWYIVDNAPNCPPDTALMTFTVLDPPNISLNIAEETVCLGSAINATFTYPAPGSGNVSIAYSSTTTINNSTPALVVESNIQSGTGTLDLQNTAETSSLNIDFAVGDWIYYEVVQYSNSMCNYTISNIKDSVRVSDINRTILNGPICPGDSIVVNGVSYNENNPTGEELFVMSEGCDSMVVIDLQFFEIPESNFVFDGCAGQDFNFNGIIVTEGNPSISTTLFDAAANGCDSIINLQVNFLEPDTTFITDQLCANESIDIAGTNYNSSNTSGTETLTNMNGCDSVLIVNLSFEPEIINNINSTFCADQSIEIAGTTYNASNTSGTHVLQTAMGCDSTINVDLTFVEAINTELNSEFCAGQAIMINGTTYDQANPMGSETFTSQAGCDSIVNINLSFVDAINSELNSELCAGEAIMINGTTYDQANPMGSETFTSQAGCDSIVNINLSFVDAINSEMNSELCAGQSIMINGTTYDQANPMGSETFTSQAGCDSIVSINLSFVDAINSELNSEFCAGQAIVVNGTTYDQANPMGSETFTSQAGCDSIVSINLSFVDAINTALDSVLCNGETLIFNGQTLDNNNLSASQTLASVAGCDSIVTMTISYEETTFDVSTNTPCPDEMGMVTISNIAGNNPLSYTLDGVNTAISGTEISIPVSSLSGEIILQDGNNCTYGVSYNITPATALTPSHEINNNVLTITGVPIGDISNIEISPNEGLSCNNCLEATITNTEAVTYTATITTMDGCVYMLSIPFTPEVVPGSPEYYVPNAFSPNRDGSNDIFYVVPNQYAASTILSMRIFDRWGNLVYLKENYEADISVGWDGTFNGKDVNPGVYIYAIEVNIAGQIQHMVGDITLVR